MQLDDGSRSESVSDSSIKTSSAEFWKLFAEAVKGGNLSNIQTGEWEQTLSMLADVSASRARQGSSPTETAKFVFSLKPVLFDKLNAAAGKDANSAEAKLTWEISTLLDKLGLYTTEVFQKSRESVIRRTAKRHHGNVHACDQTLGSGPGCAIDRYIR